MTPAYDKYYEVEDLFGEPYPELMDFFESQNKRGKLLDLGCGQGRDAIALARLGYDVTGIDTSLVGVQQMKKVAASESLQVTGIVMDIYEFREFAKYDVILLDSMLHFQKSGSERETGLVKRVIKESKDGVIIVFCVQNTGTKIATLDGILDEIGIVEKSEKDLLYVFEDKQSGHVSETDYKMIVVRK